MLPPPLKSHLRIRLSILRRQLRLHLPPVTSPPPTAPTAASKSAKKKSPSPLSASTSSTSSSTKGATAPASINTGKSSKKNKKSSSPALTPSLNGDLIEPAAVAKETPENVLKNLQSYTTSEAKLDELTTRHAAAVTLNRELDSQVKLEQRRTLAALKEKEMISGEHQKALLAKSKLESLCRELQKHSKMIKEEAMKRAQIEESKRKEVADSFQSTIDEVTSRMQNNSERNNALRDQNEELASKMKHLVEQYEQREEHIDKILKHKDLELQLVQAKLDKAEAEKKELAERSGKEREVLLAQTLESVKKNQMLEQNEKHLRAQIELYTEKYDEFQSTLSKSNTVFNNFKSEMAQMTKKIKKLEKEIQMWKGRYESSNSQLEKITKEKESGEARKLHYILTGWPTWIRCRSLHPSCRQTVLYPLERLPSTSVLFLVRPLPPSQSLKCRMKVWHRPSKGSTFLKCRTKEWPLRR